MLVILLVFDRLHSLRRSQDLGGGAAASRAQRRGALRSLSESFADLIKFVLKEPVIPAGANKGVFLLAPFVMGMLALGGLGGDPGGGWLGDRRHQCRHALHFRDLVAVGLRRDHGRLGVQLEIPVPVGAALCGADGVLRSLDRLRDRHRAAARRHAEPVRHRRAPRTRHWGFPSWAGMWSAAVPDVRDLLRLGAGRDQPAAFRSRRGRVELVAGFMVEYSSSPYMLFMLAEYRGDAHDGGRLQVILFMGGWLSPIPFPPFTWMPGLIWFLLKLLLVFFMFSMVKAFVPRYRYDQLMRLGWKVFLPLSLAMVVIVAGLCCEFTRLSAVVMAR